MVDRSGLRAHRTRSSAVPTPMPRMLRAIEHCHQNSTRPSRCFHACHNKIQKTSLPPRSSRDNFQARFRPLRYLLGVIIWDHVYSFV